MTLRQMDTTISTTMQRIAIPGMRYALAIVFIWFGILKPLGISPAAPLVLQTVDWMPVFDPGHWLNIIGWWEVAIGVLILFPFTVRAAIALLALQMVGTFMPLVMLPEITFQEGRIPYGLTMEGQYIIKNLLIIAGALVVGGAVRPARSQRGSAPREDAGSSG